MQWGLMAEKKEETAKKTSYEKPVSLSGASFKEVIRALLKTKPMPPENDKRVNNGKKEN